MFRTLSPGARREPAGLAKEVLELKDEIALLRAARSDRMCPICLERFPDFKPYNKRRRARCPSCAASERHRLSWLYLASRKP
jgi:hypothetical protein